MNPTHSSSFRSTHLSTSHSLFATTMSFFAGFQLGRLGIRDPGTEASDDAPLHFYPELRKTTDSKTLTQKFPLSNLMRACASSLRSRGWFSRTKFARQTLKHTPTWFTFNISAEILLTGRHQPSQPALFAEKSTRWWCWWWWWWYRVRI